MGTNRLEFTVAISPQLDRLRRIRRVPSWASRLTLAVPASVPGAMQARGSEVSPTFIEWKSQTSRYDPVSSFAAPVSPNRKPVIAANPLPTPEVSNAMVIDSFVERIGYRESREPTAETLRRIHRAHLLTVPFENLNIPLGRPITLAVPVFYDKIVRRRRGGFCYELNGLFAWLLEQLGYRVTMLSGRVLHNDQPGPEFDHMVLLVDLGERWIADVGFGDSFLEPLRLATGEQHGGSFRLIESGSDWILQRKSPESDWISQYAFSLIPRQLDEFSHMCHYQQTSPDSIFTRKSICSIATADGRVTLSNGRLIMTAGGGREERVVESAAEYRALLATHFGVTFPDEAPIEGLLI